MSILNKLKFWDNTVNLTAYTGSYEMTVNNPPIVGRQKTPKFFSTVSREPVLQPNVLIKRPATTIISCPGIRDYLNTGFHITMWSDLIVKIWPEGKFTYLFPETAKYNSVGHHGKNQFGELYPDGRVSIKLLNPWMISSDRSAKFLMADSHYSTSFFRDNDLWVPPGIVDFTKQMSTNIHVVCPIKSEPYELFFKMGMPLVTFFPLTEKKIKLTTKVMSDEDIENLSTLPPSFSMRYFKRKR